MGEPGIGKTRTCEELATYAGLRGAQVLWGRCYETGGQPPYWPWVQAIRSYVREIDPAELRRQMGSSASVVAEIVTDVKDRLPDLQPPQQLDDQDSARFRLFDSITSFLRSASLAQPLVIVLDDLHWSDRASLAFLEFMAREFGRSRVLLICTYRDMELNRRHPLTATLGDLARERLYERVLLRGLAEPDIARFIEIAAGFSTPRELAATVHRHTEGNPLFVTEVVRDLVQSGELTPEKVVGREAWSVRIPEGVREVVGRRLDRLSERCNETLTLAAVIGREFSLDALKSLSEDATELQLLDAVEEALSARVIEELPAMIGHYQFTHALIQETLTGEQSAARQVRFHARIAEALEAMYGEEADEHAAELVPHFADAEPVLGTRKMIHYSVIAGERAMDAFAPGDALTHFDRAEAAIDVPDDEPLMGRIWFGGAMAAVTVFATDRLQVAWGNLVRAFEWYLAHDDIEAAIATAQIPTMFEAISQDAAEFHERALQFAPSDSAAAGWINACLAAALNGRGDIRGSRIAAERAEAIARTISDERMESYLLYCRSNSALSSGDAKSAIAATSTGLTLARRNGYVLSEIRLLYFGCCAQLATGNLQAARKMADELQEAADRVKDGTYSNSAMSARCAMAWLAGDRESVMELAEEWDRRGMEGVSQRGWLVHAAVHEFGGTIDFESLLERTRGFVDRLGNLSYDVRALAFLGGAVASLESVELFDAIETAARKMLASIQDADRVWTRSVVDTCLALVAVYRSDATLARAQYDRVKPGAGKFDPWVLLSYDRVLGGLAATAGDIKTAETHFDDALAFADESGCIREAVWARIEYAEMLLDRDEPGDTEKATRLQDEALAITQELGMRPLTERILARREILGA